MKKLMMIMAAAFLSSAAFAQGFGNFDQGEMVKNRTEEQVKQYKLNEDQAKKLEALNTKYAEKMGMGFMMMGGGRGFGGARRGGQGGPGGMGPGGPGGMGQGGPQGGFGGGQMPQMSEEQRAQMQERMKQMQENREAYDKELEAIFTPEQFKAYKEDQEKNRSRRGPGMGGPRPQ